jgi:hypothetical protein
MFVNKVKELRIFYEMELNTPFEDKLVCLTGIRVN